MATEQEINKNAVRRFLGEILSEGKLAVIDEVFTADYIEHSSPPQLPSHGREAIIGMTMMFRTAFPDLRIQIDDLLADGDKVVCRNVGMGTHLGEFFGIPATGRAGAMAGIHVYRMVNGQIAEHWGNSDDFGLLVQLGVIPAPTAA